MADYSITAVTRRVSYSGSAGTGPYAFNFPVLVETDLAVYKNSSLLTLTADYTVSITASTGTGSVTLGSAASASDQITISGARAIERTTDFVTAGDLLASTLNTELDSQTIFVQQVSEDVGRAVKAPGYDPLSIDLTLPAKADRASKIMAFDGAGNATTVATDSLSMATLQAFTDWKVDAFTAGSGQTAYTLSADPGQKTNTQVNINGVTQEIANYSLSGTTVTLSAAPETGAKVEIRYGQAAATYVPSANTIPMEAILTSDIDTDLSSVSGSDDTLASAKAIKTYVDAQVTAQDLDFQADSGGALNIDLDSESLTLAGGTGIDTVGSGNTVTASIDSTVATLTGSQTLTNKTLSGAATSGDLTLTGATSGRNIVFDASDNALEFADSAKAVFGTSPDLSIYHDGLNSYVTETGDGTGNLFVLASNLVLGDQGNAHSYLSGASGGAVTIYHDNDQKFATTSGGISVTGEVAATSLDISGDADIDGTLEADAMTLNGTAITATATLSTGISNNNVPKFTSGVADNDFLRVDGTAIEGRSAAEVLSDIAAAPAAGNSSIVTTGALNSGSITSGFGAIDNGSSAITTTGTVSAGDVSVTGDLTVGDDLHLDSDSAVLKFGDDAEITLTHVHNAGLSLNSNLYIADNKTLNIGTSNDLTLYHDEGNSIIADQGTGVLAVRSNGTGVHIQEFDGTAMGDFLTGDAVKLHFNGSKKFETTGSGVAVTGDISATGDVTIGDDLLLDSDAAVLKFGDDQEITLTHAADVGLALNTGSTVYRSGAGQYDAGFSVREGTAGKAHFEWGHGNTSGYGCTLATTNGGGAPYVGWNCGPGTESNTWRTYGIRGLAQLVSHGVMYFYDVADATQDNQAPSGTANKEGTDSVARITLNATNGNLSISGALSKGSGSFLIDHPLESKKDTHNLRYSFVESPYCELNHRGKVTLSGGSATVDIDAEFGMTAGTFEALSTNPQVWLQNNDGWTAVKGSVSGSTLTITAQDADCADEIDWLVIAERADPHILETDWTDENGRPIVEPEKAAEREIEDISE